MKTSTRVALIVAAVLIVAGVILVGGTLLRGNSAGDLFASRELKTREYEITDAFTAISVEDTVSDISLVPSKGKECRVVCREDPREPHVAAVESGMLTVRTQKSTKWYENISFGGISAESPSVTIYLPKGEYETLTVKTDTGDVSVPEAFRFGTLRIDSDTGDIECLAPVNDRTEIATDTGDIRIESTMQGDMVLSTHTGRITLTSLAVLGQLSVDSHTGNVVLTDMTCFDADIQTTTGKVTLTGALISGLMKIETDTGDVTLDRCDAGEAEIETDTGDVTGTFLSDKIFLVSSDTGDIDVPRSVTGGRCEVDTDTGDIKLSVLPKA